MNSQLETVVFEMEKAVRGKRGVIEHILAALLAEGHILLDDMPGVGKTTLAVALSRAVDLRYRRVQFTPDVMPSDIVGFSVYEPQSGQFVYHEGAATHANLLLGDEINRTSSKTQSALLEAMEERQITVDGRTYPLEKPFVVIATQNNVGTAGTQLLPYAQMDRFMARLSVGYPDHDAQMALLKDRLSENPLDAVSQVLTREELLAMQAEARAVQPVRPAADSPAFFFGGRAESAECLQVIVDGARADGAAARKRQRGRPGPGQERAEKEARGAHGACERRWDCVFRKAARIYGKGRAAALAAAAEMAQDLQRVGHVEDIGAVMQDAGRPA